MVIDLFQAALRPSSQTTYKTGQRAYSRFLQSMQGGVYFPFKRRILPETELNLAFFMAFLLLEPSINKASTILNYETHVKYLFRAEGCPTEMWTTPFLRQIRKGLQNILPSHSDSRRPLLLPLIMSRPQFLTVVSDTQRLLRFATILGFIGMLRPHSIEALKPQAFSMVTARGEVIQMPSQPARFQEVFMKIATSERILGFFITFKSKTMDQARAYFPTLSNVANQTEFALICPLLALTDITHRGWMKKGLLKQLNKKKRFTEYLQHLTGLQNYIAPYALRIGGRTWLLSKGMDRQLVDYLGTWKSPEASARYFRAAPHAVLVLLQRFYFSQANWYGDQV